MADWLNAEVVENKQWNARLHSLRLAAELPAFKAGQFTRLGLDIDGEIVSRPFSLVNAPHEPLLDFYFIEVPEGSLSPALAKLTSGDRVLVSPKAAGLLTLDQVPESRHLFLLATGTGIGPFLSIIKTKEPWQRFDRVVLVHGVRYMEDLNYRDSIEQVRAAHPDAFSYVPMVTREQCDFAMSGRISHAVEDGRLERLTGVPFDRHCHVMLCGNPDMVQHTTDALIDKRGLTRHTRREPGHISIEKYW